LEELTFHLLEGQRALDDVTNSIDRQLRGRNRAESFAPASRDWGTTNSTWRLYLSMQHLYIYDVWSGQYFATALALLSRVGLEENRAQALLHELAGDDRGIQLLLGSAGCYFCDLAIHAKSIDPKWWSDMKRRILHLPLARWDTRNVWLLHSSQQDVVDEIESAPPCEKCAEAELNLRQSLGFQPPAPTIIVTPVDSVRIVEGADETRTETLLPTNEAISSSASSSGYGGAFTEAAAAEQQYRTGAQLWTSAIARIRAVARLAALLRRRASDLEKQVLTDQERVETDI
ncbi:hypothetical protein BKA62DRAFT_822343, partial [Auriculariales sp. MPI-PUGE-AT-0066]